MKRIDALKELAFEKKDFDAFLVASESNLFYLTGTPGAACLLIPKKGENTIYVYGVNFEQTKAEAKGFKVELLKRGEKLGEKIGPGLKALNVKKLASDPLNYELHRLLARAIRGHAKLKMQGDLISGLRKVKGKEELDRMRKAGEITVAGMKAAYETIRPDVTEIEVAAEIEYAMRKKGGYGTAFGTIVASGIRSAYPHGGCAERKIRKGDLVVVDIGAVYEYYCSDMTRTFAAGEPSDKQKKLYEVVKTAEREAYQAIRAKARGKDVDQAARKIIEDAGYGEYFNHGLGHGVGLEVHEGPGLSPISKDRLAVGNVVTDEPGIYIPGLGGVRIEDSVLVKQRVSEKFTDGFYSLETAR
ncbi:MAG: aminopeptidase P family protein [Candidatus Bathyarchaeia archaeon]